MTEPRGLIAAAKEFLNRKQESQRHGFAFLLSPLRDSDNAERERNGSLSNYSAKVQEQQGQSPTTKDTMIAAAGLCHNATV